MFITYTENETKAFASDQYGLIVEKINHHSSGGFYESESGLCAYQGDFKETGLNSFGFGAGNYDTSEESGKDSLIYSTLIGGSDFDESCSVAVDIHHCVYITGWTKSDDLPLTNAFDDSFNGGDSNPGGDCFVLKLSPDGQSIIYSTFIHVKKVGYFFNIGFSIFVATDFPFNFFDLKEFISPVQGQSYHTRFFANGL